MKTSTARGAASGAVGVLATDVITWLLYRREDRLDLLREKRRRPYGKDTAQALVRRVTDAAGSAAGSSEPNGAGIAVHYGLGLGPGALYAEQDNPSGTVQEAIDEAARVALTQAPRGADAGGVRARHGHGVGLRARERHLRHGPVTPAEASRGAPGAHGLVVEVVAAASLSA
jgi:hypothetical protein